MATCTQVPVEELDEGDVMIDMAQRTIAIESIEREGADYLVTGIDERRQQGVFYVVHGGTKVRVLTS